MSRRQATAGAVALLVTWQAACAELGFRILPITESFHPSQALGVSPDGTYVVGEGWSADGPEAFRWSAVGGVERLGGMPGGMYSAALGISGDGATVVGHGYLPNLGYQPFRWRQKTGMVALTPPGGGAYATAWDASFDGSVVVGHYNEGGAFVFGPDGSARSIPMRVAQAVSSDGRLVVGSNPSTIAAVYDLETGGTRVVGHLPGHALSYGRDITPDGRAVVGLSLAHGYTDDRAFIWTEGEGIMAIEGDGTFVPRSADAVSADGRVAVGSHEAGVYVWLAERGARDLRHLLGDRIPAELRIWEVRGVSADGTVMVGRGRFGLGEDVAWVATIPGPSALGLLVVVAALSGRRGRSRRL